MPQFDPEVWKVRANRRFQKASSAGRADAEERLALDLSAINRLARVVRWCGTRQIDVEFTQRDDGGLYTSGDDKTRARIDVNGRLAPERQLFVLLHECGHHLIGDRKSYQRYGNGWRADSGPAKRTLLHRIDVIDEELEAWFRGRKLAKRLKIDLNITRYNQTRARYVKTYLHWAARKKGNGNEKAEAENEPQGCGPGLHPGSDVPIGNPPDGEDRLGHASSLGPVAAGGGADAEAQVPQDVAQGDACGGWQRFQDPFDP